MKTLLVVDIKNKKWINYPTTTSNLDDLLKQIVSCNIKWLTELTLSVGKSKPLLEATTQHQEKIS